MMLVYRILAVWRIQCCQSGRSQVEQLLRKLCQLKMIRSP